MDDDGAEEIIASLRRTYAAVSRGDYESAVEIAHPDVVLMTPDGITSLRGVDKLRTWLEPETIENVSMEPELFEIAGNNVLVRQLSRGRGSASGITVATRFWTVWTFSEEGLVTQIVTFREDEEAKARDAAGVSG